MKTILKALAFIVATYYIFEASFNLMTYPSDMAFIGGVFVLALYLGVVYVGIKKFLKEKNEDR